MRYHRGTLTYSNSSFNQSLIQETDWPHCFTLQTTEMPFNQTGEPVFFPAHLRAHTPARTLAHKHTHLHYASFFRLIRGLPRDVDVGRGPSSLSLLSRRPTFLICSPGDGGTDGERRGSKRGGRRRRGNRKDVIKTSTSDSQNQTSPKLRLLRSTLRRR